MLFGLGPVLSRFPWDPVAFGVASAKVVWVPRIGFRGSGGPFPFFCRWRSFLSEAPHGNAGVMANVCMLADVDMLDQISPLDGSVVQMHASYFRSAEDETRIWNSSF